MRTMRPLVGRRGRSLRLLVIFVALLAVVSAALAAVVYGHAHGNTDTFSVTDCSQYGSSGDAGGTLFDALASATSDSGATIAFNCTSGGTIAVPATITITTSLNFAAGSTSAILSGGGQVGVFDLSGAIAVSFTGLTIADGLTNAENADGSAIYNAGATLTLTNMTLNDNAGRGTYSNGGAIFNDGGAITITASTFTGNTVQGASTGDGGAIFNRNGGTISIANSTFSGNSASGAIMGGFGGALNVWDAQSSITVVNSTFAGNSAQSHGSAVYINSGSMTFTNTLLANSAGGTNCGGIFPTDGGYNLEDANTCGFTAANHDLVNVSNPGIGALGGNGGPTATIPLNPGSPAIDAGSLSTCPAVDQRGASRPQGLSCDIGAFELALPTAQASVGSPSYNPGSSQPIYVTSHTPITLTGVDAGHGVGSISYCAVPQGTSSCTFTTTTHLPAVATIAGADGIYQLNFYASDSAGDAGHQQSTLVTLDNTSPTSVLNVKSIHIAPSEVLTVTATDAGSGVQSVAYRFYPRGGTAPAFTIVSGATASFNVVGGATPTRSVNAPKDSFIIQWYAVDNLGNTEAVQSQSVVLVTPPPSSKGTPTPGSNPSGGQSGGQTANTSPTPTGSTANTALSATPSPAVNRLSPAAPPTRSTSTLNTTQTPPISLLLLIALAALIAASGTLVLVRRSRRVA